LDKFLFEYCPDDVAFVLQFAGPSRARVRQSAIEIKGAREFNWFILWNLQPFGEKLPRVYAIYIFVNKTIIKINVII